MESNLEHSVQFGRTSINFTVNKKNRRTLGVNVLPSGRVTVDAPLNTSIEKIKEKVYKRASWILKQKREISTFPPPMPPKKYLAGETFLYLGNQYRLAIFESKIDQVSLSKRHIEIFLSPKTTPHKTEILLKRWFRNEAKRIFEERLTSCMSKVEKIGVKDIPTIKLRKMEKRWGSCTHNDLIILNPELISAPIECVDYVILHELCHLKEHSHNQHFYQLLSVVLPDWETHKLRLNQADIPRVNPR